MKLTLSQTARNAQSPWSPVHNQAIIKETLRNFRNMDTGWIRTKNSPSTAQSRRLAKRQWCSLLKTAPLLNPPPKDPTPCPSPSLPPSQRP